MYDIQLITESVKGKHNIATWCVEEIAGLDPENLVAVQQRAILFLDTQEKELESKARIEELFYHFDSKEACAEAITNAVLQTVILIKPEYLMRGGVEMAFPGVSPIQAVATQIGLHLHHDQIDAVSTGMEIIADFADIGMYSLFFGEDEHGHDTCVVQSNFTDIETLQSKIKATQYLPPMLTQPAHIN